MTTFNILIIKGQNSITVLTLEKLAENCFKLVTITPCEFCFHYLFSL